MDNLHLIHMLFMAKPLNGMNWVENLAQFITQPFVSLIFTCIIFIGFLYQLYSKRINLMGIIALLALLLLFLAFLIKWRCQCDVSITVYNWPHTTDC